jgi:hypothetical protein
MSLISDALKKARAEAARQDSLRQGMPYAIGVADAPARRTPWISLLAGLGAGCILAAAVFAVAFFAGWGPFHKPAVETQVAAAPMAPVPAAPAPQAPAPAPVPAPVVQTPAPAALPVAPVEAPPAAVKPVPQTAPQAAPQIAPQPIARNPAPETAPAPPASALAPVPAPAAPVEATPSQPAPAPSSSSSGLTEGNTYVGELPVPGGGSVKLNGIVFSPDHPIAVLDGRVMAPGEIVQGFTVVAIESGRVKLQGHGATVYLSSK